MPLLNNWRTFLSIIALVIVIGTVFYSRYLANQIAQNERKAVESWVSAQQFIANATSETDITFASLLVAGQQSIPVIETTEKDSIINHVNITSGNELADSTLLNKKLREFSVNAPIITYFSSDSSRYNKYYYGESTLLKEVRHFPLLQLLIVSIFLLFAIISINARHKAEQDSLWAGLAKETAHQLGTPVSALQGWVEMLRESGVKPSMVNEMEKDVIRLKLVSERFSRIGSPPNLEQRDLVEAVRQVLQYIKTRASGKVNFSFTSASEKIIVPLAAPLFEWVVENLLRNALDALPGEGQIDLRIGETTDHCWIDITDSGKGITPQQLEHIFEPGYTTRKRGWGLGLTLSKRVIETYHRGTLVVKQTETGKGTTFRISIPKSQSK